MYRLTTTAIAALLLLAACGTDSGDETTTDDAPAPAAENGEENQEAEETNDDSASGEPADGGDAAGSDGAGGDGGDDGAGGTDDDTGSGDQPSTGGDENDAGIFVNQLLSQTGLEPTPELLGCIEDRGVDLQAIPGGADTEDDLNTVTFALFACAPDELAPVIAADTEPPEGTTSADVECVAAETFRYLGNLPVDEATVLLEADEPPPQVRDAVIGAAQDACDLSEDQINAILDA